MQQMMRGYLYQAVPIKRPLESFHCRVLKCQDWTSLYNWDAGGGGNLGDCPKPGWTNTQTPSQGLEKREAMGESSK